MHWYVSGVLESPTYFRALLVTQTWRERIENGDADVNIIVEGFESCVPKQGSMHVIVVHPFSSVLILMPHLHEFTGSVFRGQVGIVVVNVVVEVVVVTVAGVGTLVQLAQTSYPSSHVCSNFVSPGCPHLPRQDPPAAQQVNPFLPGTHLAHSNKWSTFCVWLKTIWIWYDTSNASWRDLLYELYNIVFHREKKDFEHLLCLQKAIMQQLKLDGNRKIGWVRTNVNAIVIVKTVPLVPVDAVNVALEAGGMLVFSTQTW